MTFRQFEYICIVMQEGSFTKAAKKLFISESALSQQISSIEKEYNVKIVNRKTKPIKLTKEGHVIYEAAEKILNIKKNMEEELTSQDQGKLYIKTIEFFSITFIPKILSILRDKYPNAEMKIFDAATEELFIGQYYENIDLYVHSFDMLTDTNDSSMRDEKFEHEKIGSEKILLATSINNSILNNANISDNTINLRKLKNAKFIVPSTSNYLEHICHKLCFERGGYEPICIRVEPTLAKTVGYLQYNDCWAVLPDTVSRYYNSYDNIRFLNIEGETTSRQIIATHPKRTKVSPIAKDFINLAKDLLSREGD